jgi:hypothetical protein
LRNEALDIKVILAFDVVNNPGEDAFAQRTRCRQADRFQRFGPLNDAAKTEGVEALLDHRRIMLDIQADGALGVLRLPFCDRLREAEGGRASLIAACSALLR